MITEKLKHDLILVVAGIILGVLTVFFKGTVSMLFVIILTAAFLLTHLPAEDRPFLMKVFLSAITMRVVALFIFYIIDISRGGYGEITPDSRLYSIKALALYKSWLSNTVIPLLGDERAFKREGNVYVLAFFYSLLGRYSPISNPVSIFSDKLINCLLGAITAVPFFYLSKDMFGRKTAKVTAVLVAFFPSLFLWSMTNNKDTANILLVCLLLFSTVRLIKYGKAYHLFLIILYLALIYTIRPYIFATAGLSVGFSFLVIYAKKRPVALFLLLLLFITFLNLTKSGIEIRNNYFVLDRLLQRGYASNEAILAQGGSVYRIYDSFILRQNIPAAIKLLFFFSKGWFYFLLVPLPWMIKTMFQAVAYPQMVLWYACLFFALIGISLGIKSRLKISIPALFYIFITTSTFALMEGNIGSTLRHRDLVVPVYFIFSAAGIIKFLEGDVKAE